MASIEELTRESGCLNQNPLYTHLPTPAADGHARKGSTYGEPAKFEMWNGDFADDAIVTEAPAAE